MTQDKTFLKPVKDLTFKEALYVKNFIESKVDFASKQLKQYPRLPNGLTSDEVKATAIWQQHKEEYSTWFNLQRKFNQSFLKVFKKEYKEYMKELREESLFVKKEQ